MKCIISVFALLLFFSVCGQNKQGPPLLYKHLPQSADSVSFYYLKFDSTLVPGPGGANVQWDFVNIERSKTLSLLKYNRLSYIPGTAFKNATCIVLKDPFNYYLANLSLSSMHTYYEVDSMGMYAIGYAGNDWQFNAFDYDTFQPIKCLVKTPFYFNDSIKASYNLYQSTLDSPWSNGVYREAKYSLICDGFGVLRLPGQVFDSVIRTHYTEKYDLPPWSYLYFGSIDKYSWYDVSYRGQGFRMPIFELFKELDYTPGGAPDNGVEDLTKYNYMLASYNDDSIITIASINNPQNIFNPEIYFQGASDNMLIKSAEGIYNARWQISDVLGRQLVSGVANIMADIPFQINCTALKSGAYIFQINNATFKFVKP